MVNIEEKEKKLGMKENEGVSKFMKKLIDKIKIKKR
jgi:hypothetical protein